MMLRPSIFVNRLVVTKGGARVLDLTFHNGLNVIRGVNGSGKTTIADFIFFGLGGDTPQWRAEAALCDYVFLEIAVNGTPVTLRRQVEQEKSRPMAISWASLDQPQNAETEWQLHPYAATSNKESFTQVIFRAAGMPDVKGAATSKITLNQVLRLIYVDQRTDYEQLFRAQPFDEPLVRQAVGDLLCGVYDDGLYDAEIGVSERESEKSRLQSELRAIYTILGSTGIPEPIWLQEDKARYTKEREEAYAKLKTVQSAQPASADPLLARRAQVASELAAQNKRVHDLQEQIANARTEIADRAQFLDALSTRLQALTESEAIHENLGAFSFSFCPACYAPLLGDGDACHLCKSPSEDRKGQNLLALRRELEQQIHESEQMQQAAQEQLQQLEKGLSPEKDRQRTVQLRFEEISTSALSTAAAANAEIHQRIGYLDRTIEEIEKRAQLADRLAAISTRQATLSAEISKLNDEIAARKASQEQIKEDIYEFVAQSTKRYLRSDIPREDAFITAQEVNFDFSGNSISVDGRRTFAASSNVLLKNIFHLALFEASLARDYMRYPRLLIFDNVEDKGMEPVRSHNFQRLVRALSDETETDHQIIMFTSMVEPTFDNDSTLVVGPHYTLGNKSLQMGPVTPATTVQD